MMPSVQSFLDASPEQITEVVQTNLLGTLLCTRAAMQALAAQKRGGHIFNMDGAGANNLPSPMYAAYGATKAGECPSLCSFTSTLQQCVMHHTATNPPSIQPGPSHML